MMTFKQHGVLLGALAVACFCIQTSNAQTPAVTNAAKPAADLFPDTVMAKGKGVEVKRSQVEDAVVAYKANAAARNPGAPDMPRDVVESNILQRLIVVQILVGKGTPEDKTKAKELTDKFIEDTRKQFPSEELFVAQVKATGMSIDQLRDRAQEQNLCELVLERELKSKIVVSDAEAKKFYDENPTQFEQPEQVRASHILISTLNKDTQEPLPNDQKKEKEKLAKDLKARAEKGEDFAKLAKEYSDDPGSKDKGGEYTFPRGQMVKEFEAAAFSLKTNQVSDVVETRFGYHIIKLSEKIPASTTPLDKVSDRLKDYLKERELQKQLPDYLEKLKKEAGVELIAAKSSGDTNAPAAK